MGDLFPAKKTKLELCHCFASFQVAYEKTSTISLTCLHDPAGTIKLKFYLKPHVYEAYIKI